MGVVGSIIEGLHGNKDEEVMGRIATQAYNDGYVAAERISSVRIRELEALLERAREGIYSGPVSVDANDALWNDMGRALAAAEKEGK